MSDIPVLSRAPRTELQVVETDLNAEPKPVNPLKLIHSLLRGRYVLAIGVTAAAALLGLAIGFMVHRPTYRSFGVVRIEPYLQKILYPTEQSDVMPMFDAYMDAQVAMIRSPRMIDLAMQDPRWRDLGRGLAPETIEAFGTSLEITRNGQLITVTYSDSDAQATHRAVNAVMDAYGRRFIDENAESRSARMAVLQQHKLRLDADVKRYAESIYAVGSQYSAGAVQRLYDFKLDELSKVESQLRMAELALAAAEARVNGKPGESFPLVIQDSSLLPDGPMKQYLEQQAAEELRIRRLSFRYGEKHPQVVEAKAYVAQLEALIGSMAAETHGWPGTENSPGLFGSIEAIRAHEQRLRQLHERIVGETEKLGLKNVQVDSLRRESETLRAQLEDTNSRIERLKLEEQVAGRLNIVSYAELPHQPYRNKRAQFSAACGLGMGALGFGAVLLMGLFDPRLRRIADAELGLPKIGRLLGVLPSLPEESARGEQSAMAAYCVHHIRTMLQIQQRVTGRRILAVTSPSPGDGKTSLTVALGMSYAATGAKTLLIDCDLQGGGLTTRMNSANAWRLGQILLGQQHITQDQLQKALAQARQDGKRLGDVLSEQQLVGDETIARALEVQSQMKAGLHGVIRGEPFGQCVLGTTVPNLHVLSLGSSEHRRSVQLSPSALRPIFDEAARQYDTVLVDTGPILGCVEAALVAAEADGVVLVVARGGQKTLAHGAINYLATMSAEVEGIVFNRAAAGDLAHSWYSASRSNGSINRFETSPPANAKNGTRRLGPLAGAVLPGSNGGTLSNS